MSEATPETTPTDDPKPEPQGTEPTPPADPTPEPEKGPDWKAEARKWEQRAKENSDAAKRLAEIEEASKTEAQKQADALAKAEAKVKEYEQREQVAAWAKEVSTETGVPADLLRGSTKEELEAHAEQLKPLIASEPKEPEKPGAVPTIGKQPAGAPNIPLSEQIAHAERSRDEATPGTPEWKSAQDRVMELKGMQLFEAAQVAK